MRRPDFIARQASRPSGWLGRLLLRIMEGETAAFNREVVTALAPRATDRILELGFGHGRTLAELADALPEATLAGLDLSAEAAHAAARRLRRRIDASRLDLRVGDSAALPWPSASFEAALAVHTLYFWPEPARDVAELHRVLAPGGRLAFGFRERTPAAEATFPPPIYRFPSVEEVGAWLVTAGFGRLEIRKARGAPELYIATADRT